MICLVRPPAVESFRFATTSISMPLGLAYIAGALETAGHKVAVVDAVGLGFEKRARYYKGYLVGLALEDIVARIPAESRIIGVSCIFTHEWPAVLRLVELVKRRFPNVPVVVGGEHCTSMPEFCLMTSKADVVVLGEGEETIVELVAALDAGRKLDAVDGIAWREGASVRVNKRRARRVDVDAIPLPSWDHFDVAGYHQRRFVGGMYSDRITVPILATRGCPYQCTYCSSPNMWTPRWIPRQPKRVVDEIESYVKRYDAGNFPFQDLTAIIQKEWIVEFCQEILRRGLDINWQLSSGTRSEAIDDEVADLLRRSGMINMAYAPESGSETTRRYIKKKMQTERLFGSIASAVKAELNVSVFLVIGFPHDRPEHLAENLPFIDRLAAAGVTDMSVGYYMALPGTELFHSLYDAGRIKLDRAYFRHILDSLAIWPSQTYADALGTGDLFRWKSRMYRRFYGAKRKRKDRKGLGAAVRRALSGFKRGAHRSKLETVFRNAASTGLDTLRTRFQRGWMPRAEERALFADWDAIYRRIREGKLATGAAVRALADTSRLHESNVVATLKRDHETPRAFEAPVPAAAE
jgi:radical SAM superfamily enzyme YgiQ (UPF0313 family)